MNSARIVRLMLACIATGFALLAPLDLQRTAMAAEPAVSSDAREFLNRMSKSLSEVGETAKPSVVNISTTTTVDVGEQPFGEFFNDPLFKKFFGDNLDSMPKRKFKSSSLGSGVIVSRDGYILTTYHVVQNAEEIKITLNDKREFKGKVIGSDPQTDIAVIKIEAKELPAVRMGNSGSAKAGDVVVAIGNPFGLNQTITMGIVSAVGRVNIGISEYEDFIQTDAAINPGNSGGALVNTNGDLIGINTAIFSTSGGFMGIGFAIPSNVANSIAQSIIKQGKVIRGWLGVTVQDLTPELAKSFGIKKEQGALVTDVMKGSPAEKAGLRRGDLVTEFEGKPVENSATLRNMVAAIAPGKTVKLRVVREGRDETITATTGEFPVKKPAAKKSEPKKSEYNNALKGVNVQEVAPDLRESLNLPGEIKGVIVVNVAEDSPARDTLTKGDVIQEINRRPISGLKDYEAIASKIGPGESVLLLVYRGGAHVYVSIKP